MFVLYYITTSIPMLNYDTRSLIILRSSSMIYIIAKGIDSKYVVMYTISASDSGFMNKYYLLLIQKKTSLFSLPRSKQKYHMPRRKGRKERSRYSSQKPAQNNITLAADGEVDL